VRVALVGPVHPYRGGIAHYTTMLARALAEKHETLVISFRRQYPDWLYPGKTDQDPSRAPLRVDAEYLLDPFYPWTWQRTANRIAGFGPDVTVLQWWTTFWAPALGALAWLLRRRGLKVVFLLHNVLPHEPAPWDRWLARAVLGQTNSFIAQAPGERDRLLALLPNAQVRLCPMPAFHELAGQRLPRAEARRRLGLPAEALVLLFFGIVRPYKGLKHLIDAVAILKDSGQPAILLVAGEIWAGKAAYQQQAARLGLTDHVVLDDRYIPNEELPAFFAAADVFVAPYVSGTQSASLRTALAFGLPLVVTDAIAGDLPAGAPGAQVVSAADAPALAVGVRRAVADADWAPCAPAEHGWGNVVAEIEAAAGIGGGLDPR
jgi:glycosyltransferase involved in cell wall biosynthesis